MVRRLFAFGLLLALSTRAAEPRSDGDDPPTIISQHGDALARSTSAAALAVAMPAYPPGTPAKLAVPVPPPPPPAPVAAPPAALVVESPAEPRPVSASAPAPPPVLAPTVAERGLRALWLPAMAIVLLAAWVHWARRRRALHAH